MIKEISTFIVARAGGLTIGVDLLVGHRTQGSPVACDVVLETAGSELDRDNPDFVFKHIQVISRGETYFTARDRAWHIFKALHVGDSWNLPIVDSAAPPYLAMVIYAESDPTYIGQDEKGSFEFSTNYVFMTEEASCGLP